VTEQFYAIRKQRKSKNALVAAILKEHIRAVPDSNGNVPAIQFRMEEEVIDLA
jgi:hypothetical protein